MRGYDGAKESSSRKQVLFQVSLVSEPKVLILIESSLQEERWTNAL